MCNKALSVEEAGNVSVYYIVNLMRKYRCGVPTGDEWKVYNQMVISNKYSSEIFKMGQALPTSGHLGVNKTQDRTLPYFYWPKMRSCRRVFEILPRVPCAWETQLECENCLLETW